MASSLLWLLWLLIIPVILVVWHFCSCLCPCYWFGGASASPGGVSPNYYSGTLYDQQAVVPSTAGPCFSAELQEGPVNGFRSSIAPRPNPVPVRRFSNLPCSHYQRVTLSNRHVRTLYCLQQPATPPADEVTAFNLRALSTNSRT